MKRAIIICLSIFLICNFTIAQVNYSVSSIPHVPESYIGNKINWIYVDDLFSDKQGIGFSFPFFGNTYDSLIVSTNGSISFNTSLSGTYAHWNLDTETSLPSGFYHFFNSINAPYHDLDISTQGNIYINHLGTTPNRKMVLQFDQISLFLCTNQLVTSQIVLHETTGVIDIHIINKPICVNWNDSKALLGIENHNGSKAYAPPSRDGNAPWSTSLESWRFTPIYTSTEHPFIDKEMDMSFAPNPFTDKTVLKLKKPLNNATIEVFSMIGNKLYSAIFSGGEFVLEKTNFAAGNYFVRIKTESGNSQMFKITARD